MGSAVGGAGLALVIVAVVVWIRGRRSAPDTPKYDDVALLDIAAGDGLADGRASTTAS